MGAVDVVRMAGEIDLANAAEIERDVVEQTGRSAAVLVDLSAVSFLDSAGVRLLDRLTEEYSGRGVPVRILVPAGSALRTTLRLCAFRDDVLAADLVTAIGHLTSSG